MTKCLAIDRNLKGCRCNSINYGVYSRSACDKQLDFEISQEEFNKLVIEPCYYCDIIQERGFNGIDRLDSNIGYVADNCVSSCMVCYCMNHRQRQIDENVGEYLERNAQQAKKS